MKIKNSSNTDKTILPEQKEQAAEMLRKASEDGRIQCAAALGIARKLGLPSKEIGKIADSIQIRICNCQLNCF